MNRRLAAEERREQIVSAVIPVIAEHGPAASSRQLAEAAGVAEGTVFRAFGDKRTLLREVFERLAADAYDLDELEGVEAESLADFVGVLVGVATARLRQFLELAPMLMHELRDELAGHEERHHAAFEQFIGRIAELLAPHRDELRVPTGTAAAAIATMALASAHSWHAPQSAFAPDAAVDLLLHGIGQSPPGP